MPLCADCCPPGPTAPPAPTTTTTAAPTTSTTPAPTTTTLAPTTTTTPAATTTTTTQAGEPGCPTEDWCNTWCSATYYAMAVTGTCDGINCSDTYALARSTGCNWHGVGGGGGMCTADIWCEEQLWTLRVWDVPSHHHCFWRKVATPDSCPDGNYIISMGTCSDCEDTVTVYE